MDKADQPPSFGCACYIAGSLIAFSRLEASKLFVPFLMSNYVVPAVLGAGTLNSGWLATRVGTGD